MGRGSDSHNPRLDDELERESRGFVQGAPVDPRVEPHRKTEDTEDVNVSGDEE